MRSTGLHHHLSSIRLKDIQSTFNLIKLIITCIATLEDGGNILEHLDREQVDASVDVARDERRRLLDIMHNLICLLIDAKAAIVEGLLGLDLDTHHHVLHPFLAMAQHFVQGQITENIAKDEKEGLGIAGKDQIAEQVDRASRAEQGVLLEVADLNFELFLHLANETVQLLSRLEEANQQDLAQTVNTAACLNVMLDNGEAGNWEQWLRDVQRERSETGSLQQF